jgi:cbb3-type cytochrome oxidase subunit 3
MSRWVILLIVIVLIAIVWYLWRENARAAQRRKADEARRLEAAAGRAAGVAAATAGTAPAVSASAAEVAARRGRAAEAAAIESQEVGGGRLQDAVEAASGERLQRAAGRMDEMTAELAQSRREAEQAAERLARQASETLAAMQTAAASFGGAVPGTGAADCPPDYPIKGDQAAMLYYAPGERIYDETVPQLCFRTIAAAEAAGFAPAHPADGAHERVVAEERETVDVGRNGVAIDESAAVISPNAGLPGERADIVARAIAAADAGGVPPGAIRGDGGRDCPGAYPIKGDRAAMRYLAPGAPGYDVTIPEFCFSSVDSAESAGFSASQP